MRQLVRCHECKTAIKKYGGGYKARIQEEIKKFPFKRKRTIVVIICRDCAKQAGYKIKKD